MDRLDELERTISLREKKNYETIAQYGYLASIYSLSVLESQEYMKRLRQVVDEMGRHPDPLVKVILIMQLPKLAMVAEEEDRPYCTQWKLLLEYLIDKDEKIRKSCQLVVLFFLRNGLLDEEIVENHFCPAVNQACVLYPDTIDLMCQMIPLVGKKVTIRYFIQRFIQMCFHTDFTVREICVRNFPDICLVVGSEISQVLLLPVFIKLCHDQSINIRSACVDVFILVTCFFSMEKRKNELTTTFLDLFMDNSESCRPAAHQILGAFICTFADRAVAELLANDRFREIVISQRTVSSQSRLLNLLKAENPEEIFSKAYIEQLFPSFAISERMHMNGCEEKEDMDNPFGSYSIFDPFIQFDETEPDRGTVLDEKHSKFEVLDTSLQEQQEKECNKKASDELEEFNSFRYWYIPPMEVDLNTELGCHVVDSESTLETWFGLEGIDSAKSKQRRPEPNLSVSLTDPISDREIIASHQLVVSDHNRSGPDSENDDSQSGNQVVTNSDGTAPRVPRPTQNVVPQILLDHFTSIAVNALEKAYFCASWLPAIAFTLGPGNWTFVRDIYKSLSQLGFDKVQRTIASSLHKLVSILEEEDIVKDLIPVFEKLLFVANGDVGMNVIEHLYDFLRHLTPERRDYQMSRFLASGIKYYSDVCHWRVREVIAEQLILSMKLFTSVFCLKFFTHVATGFLRDRIASVRYKAVELMSHLIVYVREESCFKYALMDKLLLEFANHSSWRRRQVFVLLCTHLAVENILDADVFCALFLNHLLKLSNDFVPNVVLRVAQCLSVNIIKNKYITSKSPYFNDVMRVLKVLELDDDRDVRYYACLHLQEESDDEKGVPPKSSTESLSTV